MIKNTDFSEQTVPVIEHSQSQRLASSVVRHDIFANDESDEFTIIREGKKQGIFKVWSPHILPSLDYEQDDSPELRASWAKELSSKPLSLHESLEQWRGFAAVADRRLQTVFASREVSDDPDEAIAELLMRVQLSFGYAAPFYSLEALVVDSRLNSLDNPIEFHETNTTGGQLDVAAMILPSALAEHVTADTVDWHETSWESIQASINTMRQAFFSDAESLAARQYVIISRIADIASIKPESVVFAANALQFIPESVGGKKDDIDQEQALLLLDRILSEDADVTTGSVAKNFNALIRFLNWTPAIKSADNFKGEFWNYGAVCDTASNLTDLVGHIPEIAFTPTFSQTFIDELLPQLGHLDAASAKGRLLLQLFNDGHFSDTITRTVHQKTSAFTAEIEAELDSIARSESLSDIGVETLTHISGGKTQGLRRALELFGPDKVLGGKIVSSEAVISWLHESKQISHLITQLEATPDISEKARIGEQIVDAILIADMPEQIIESIQHSFDVPYLVLRSSSFDEDVAIIGPAPGIYESVIHVDTNDKQSIGSAYKAVVSSFFSEKAISYRELKGLRHKPFIAVIIQEYIEGVGGSFFVKDGEIRVTVAPHPSMVNEHHNAIQTENFTLSTTNVAHDSTLLSKQHMNELVTLASASEAVYGPSDLEFVIDNNSIKLLQLRNLHHPIKHHILETSDRQKENIAIIDLEDLPRIESTDTSLNLAIHPDIDLEKFQGSLFRWIMKYNSRITTITLAEHIPPTCHFANIVESLGIQLAFADSHE